MRDLAHHLLFIKVGVNEFLILNADKINLEMHVARCQWSHHS
jgi:hypothetical protein